MAKFQSHLLELVSHKQIRDKRMYPITAIMVETGLSRPTVERWLKGSLDRIEPDTVLKLCEWLECSFSELVEAVRDNPGSLPAPEGELVASPAVA